MVHVALMLKELPLMRGTFRLLHASWRAAGLFTHWDWAELSSESPVATNGEFDLRVACICADKDDFAVISNPDGLACEANGSACVWEADAKDSCTPTHVTPEGLIALPSGGIDVIRRMFHGAVMVYIAVRLMQVVRDMTDSDERVCQGLVTLSTRRGGAPVDLHLHEVVIQGLLCGCRQSCTRSSRKG